MLHVIINELGNCLELRDDISGKMNICLTFSFKSLASGALILRIIVIADSTLMFCLTYTLVNVNAPVVATTSCWWQFSHWCWRKR